MMQGYTSEQIGQKLETIINSHDKSTKELDQVKTEINSHGEAITSLSGTIAQLNKYLFIAQIILVVVGIIIATVVLTKNWGNLNTSDTWKGLFFSILPLVVSGGIERLKKYK